jgi:hypothetical protein
MTPVKIKGATRCFDAPKDWDENLDGPCDALFVRDGLVNGVSTMTSTWKPSAEELAALNAGAMVELGICGSSHPPVFLTVSTSS